jgi:aspartyl protease family protein
VGEQPMPYVLLGNSFLTRFQMRRDNDQLVLERRY